MPEFQPFALLPGGHLQTLGGVALRASLRWEFPSEDVVVDSEDGARLLLRASWQRESNRPALLLVHGLEGSDSSTYVVATGALAFRSGWHVVRMNMRGCGDSLPLCPRLYHAGMTQDLVAIARWLARAVSRLAVAGFSLGGGLSLGTMARERSRIPDELLAAVAVCPPMDMSACADALERTPNWFYQRRFLRSLLDSYRKRQGLSPERYQRGRERGLSTLREFDSAITAYYSGYEDAEDYYRSVSAGPVLGLIDRPTLVLASDDDPFIPAASVSKWARSYAVQTEITGSGGHVGFVGSSRAPGKFWAAERVLSFLQGVVDGAPGGDISETSWSGTRELL